MADIITNTKTVLVRLTSAAGDGRSVTLDNPKSNLTLAQIKAGFQPILAMKLLLGNIGDTLDAVESATVTTTEKVKLGDSDVEISITPNVFTVSNSSSNTYQSFTVTGSAIIGGYFTNLSAGSASVTSTNIEKVGTERIQVNLDFTATPTSPVTGQFNIVTEAGTVAIPVQIQE